MIRKIKFTGPDRTFTEVTIEMQDGDTSKTTKIKATDHRVAEFTIAMRALEPVVMELLPFKPAEVEDKLEVFGVSLTNNEDQGRGAVISCQIKAEAFNSPLIINTPHLHEDKSDSGVMAMPYEMFEAVATLIEHAEMFVAGQREQENLPFEDAAPVSRNAGGFEEGRLEQFEKDIEKTGMEVTSIEGNTISIAPKEEQPA